MSSASLCRARGIMDRSLRHALLSIIGCEQRRLSCCVAGALALAATPSRASPAGWWIRPIQRAALGVETIDEAERGYSTAARPRNIAGTLAMSCERREGRPCGDGLGAMAELDAAGGHGAWITGAVRLRARTGTERHGTALDLDRAYVDAELGPVTVELGRDVVFLGPATRTQLGWGTHAPPLDHVRVSSTRPVALAGGVRAGGTYVLGRLAAPQTYPGTLVSMMRARLDVGERLELGALHLLQLGGDGAPGLGPWGFALEHVRRRDRSASASDTSNRRVGLDAAVAVPIFGGARVTYQVMFEDLRRHMVSALRYDADHLLGVHVRWLTVECRRTGVRAYEHAPRFTGFTTGGHVVGDPLGPAASAVLIIGRVAMRWGDVLPWTEVAALASDTYKFNESGPIVRTDPGATELRIRIGVRARVPLGRGLVLDPEIALEHVEREAFLPGARRVNTLLRAMLTWQSTSSSTTLRSR